MKLPWFPLYARDFLADSRTVAMPLAARGAYLWLLCHQWMDGDLPNDAETLRLLAGANRREWSRIWPHLDPLFPPGKLSTIRQNQKLERVRRAHELQHKRLSNAGKRGNAIRWKSRDKIAPRSPGNRKSQKQISDSEVPVDTSEMNYITSSVETGDRLIVDNSTRTHQNPPTEIDHLVDYQTEVLNKLDGTNGRDRRDRGSLLLLARHVPRAIIHAALEATQDARLRSLSRDQPPIHPARYYLATARVICAEQGVDFPLAKDLRIAR